MLVVLAAIVLVGGRVFLSCAVGDKFITSPLPFDREAWIEADEPWWADPDRVRMRDDVVRRHLRVGTAREAAIAALGEPTSVRAIGDPLALRKAGEGPELWYRLGPQYTDDVWLVVMVSPEGVVTGTRRGSF